MSSQFTVEDRSQMLLEFAQIELTPSKSYRKRGRRCANQIFRALREETSFVDRVCISGSMGKNTALGDEFSPDFDLVIFCNNNRPDFADVLSIFADIVEDEDGLDAEVIKMRRFSIAINYCGFKFDICPAENFVPNTGWRYSSTREVQRDETYQRIASSRDPLKAAYHLSKGLAESSVHFLKCQDSATHSLIRLAKYWVQNLPRSIGYISGKSLLIETIAVSAAESCEEEDGSTFMYYAFREFLRKVYKLHDEEIIFYENYDEDQVPSWVMDTPLILDPSNPYNNLAGNLKPKKTRVLRKAALATLHRLGSIGSYDVEDVLDYSVKFPSDRSAVLPNRN